MDVATARKIVEAADAVEKTEKAIEELKDARSITLSFRKKSGTIVQGHIPQADALAMLRAKHRRNAKALRALQETI